MIQIEETGFQKINIGGTEIEVDLYQVNNHLIDLQAEHEGKPVNECNEAVAAYIESLGFPKVSHATAIKFSNAIFDACKGLEKKGESAE